MSRISWWVIKCWTELSTHTISTHGNHQMGNIKIRLIIFFAAKDGEVLYSQQNKTRS